MRMRFLLIIFLFLQVSCATKYIIPGNRFITPESQGGIFRSSFEFQQTSANQLTADVTQGTVDEGVTYSDVNRAGFLFSTALMEQMDFYWNHTGSANSIFGMKFQFLGGSRTANATGHKMAVSAGFGGNEHETDGSNSVLFTLNGQELQFLYGYRFSELMLVYSNFSYGKYVFSGEINSNDSNLDGLKPNYETKSMSLIGGIEIDLGSFFAKLESGYQQLRTTDTKDEAGFLFGYSLGITW